MDRDGRDRRLALIARRQAGAFSLAQAVEAGFPRSTITDRARRGAWERTFPGIFVLGGAARTRDRQLWEALLAVGPMARITHEAGALLYGAEHLPEDPVTLTVPHRWHHDLLGVFVHQIDDLLPHHLAEVRGMPVSSAARCAVELAATQPESVLGLVADDLVRLRRTTYGQIAGVFRDVLRPGKPGMVKMARVLDERSEGYVPPASVLEQALFDALRAGGLPAPQRQMPLPGRSAIRGVADAGYLDALIVMEVDGRRWHARVEAARRDRERDVQVVRAGWVPMRFVYEQVVHEPAAVCDAVAEARAVRLRLLGRAA
jgi:very-short-patch-repair endonuclease